MNRKTALSLTATLIFAAASSVQAQADADAAVALAKRNDCFKCHAIDKDKRAPAYRKIAAKFNGKSDAVEKVITHVTTGPKVKIDGEEENHKIIDTKDPAELRNLAQWLLSL